MTAFPLHILSDHRDRFCRDLDKALESSDDLNCTQRFAHALATHLRAKERCVLPALRAVRWQGVTTESLVEHVVAKRHLADLLSLPTDAERAEAAREMRRALDTPYTRHLQHLQGLLERHFSGPELTLMGHDLRADLAPAPAAPGGSADGPEALLEEARVVLSTLGSLQAGHAAAAMQEPP